MNVVKIGLKDGSALTLWNVEQAVFFDDLETDEIRTGVKMKGYPAFRTVPSHHAIGERLTGGDDPGKFYIRHLSPDTKVVEATELKGIGPRPGDSGS